MHVRIDQFIQAGITLASGLGLATAGVLALVARAEYKAWRKYQKSLMPPQPRRR